MANTTGNGNLTFPLLQGLGGSGSAGAVTFPLLTVQGFGAGEGALIFLPLEALGAGTNITAVGAVTFPLLQALGSGTPGVIGDGHLIFPLLKTSGQGYCQTIGVGELKFPLLVSGGVGLTGTIGDGALDFPLLLAGGVELSNTIGAGTLIFPLIGISGYGRIIPITFNRRAIVMHLFSHAVSHYVNFNFNSLAHFKEVFLGANEQGLFILGGKDDLGQAIQADIRTGIHDFAKDGVLTCPKEAWLAYRTDGQLELDIEVEEDKDPYPYIFDKTSQRITEARETLGKGLDERFYTFIIKNRSGSDFDLESLRILGDVISKKRR